VRSAFAAATVLLVGCGRFGFGDVPPVLDGVTCDLAFDTSEGRVNFNAHRTLTTTGGRDPVSYSIDNPLLAGLDTMTGELRAFTQAGRVVVTAEDANGCTADLPLTIGGDAIYYAGGSVASVPRREVYRSTDATNWTQVGLLPAARMYGALITFRDRLWWISGSDGSAVPDIFVSDNGADWTTAGAVPAAAATSSFAITVFEDRLYFVGGNQNGTSQTGVYRSDDAVTWTKVGDLTMPNHGGSLAVLDGKMIYAGGHNSTMGLFDWVCESSDDGVTWPEIGNLAIGREYHSAVVMSNRLYVIGGQDTTPTALSSVASTADGVTWQPEPALPAGRAFGPVVRIDGTLFSLGGTDMGGVFKGSAGGTWTTVPSTFPLPRQGGSAAFFTPVN